MFFVAASQISGRGQDEGEIVILSDCLAGLGCGSGSGLGTLRAIVNSGLAAYCLVMGPRVKLLMRSP